MHHFISVAHSNSLKISESEFQASLPTWDVYMHFISQIEHAYLNAHSNGVDIVITGNYSTLVFIKALSLKRVLSLLMCEMQVFLHAIDAASGRPYDLGRFDFLRQAGCQIPAYLSKC